jgi:hypothetical protein
MENWRTKEINLLDSDTPGAQGTRIFSAKMPIGWDTRPACPMTNFWYGRLVGQEFILDLQGGPIAVSILDDIVGAVLHLWTNRKRRRTWSPKKASGGYSQDFCSPAG